MKKRKGPNFIKIYRKNAVAITMTFAIITGLLISSFAMASQSNESNILANNQMNKIMNIINLDENPEPLAIQWAVTVYYNEPGGANTNTVFGEAPDASDGQDSYDTPLPPAPFPPYIRSWFDAGLSGPYAQLLKDYRFYPDTEKQWNLTIQWVPSDYVSPTDITVSWNTASVNASEYDYVVLYDVGGTTIVANMFVNDSYVFTCPALALQSYQIICETDSEPPEIINNSPGTGETGDLFTFNATVTDNFADASSLLVKVNWSHGSFSGNDTMVNVAGTDYFTKQITLDESTSDLTYHLYAEDTAKSPNSNYTAELSATINDDEYPTPVSDDTTTVLTTGEPITFGLTVTDNIDINYVYANYRWRQGGSWSGWNTDVAMSEGASNDWTTSGLSTPSDATDVEYYFEVNDYTHTVYIYNGSLAVTTTESVAQGSAFGKTIQDNDDPTFVDSSPSSGTTGDAYVFDVDPDDNIGVSGVTVTWNHGILGGTDVAMVDDGDGTYSLSIVLDDSLSDMDYAVTVTDTSANTFTGATQYVTVTDNDDPSISDVSASPTSQVVDGYVNISGTVTDNINLNTVNVDITGPSGFIPINTSMTQNGGDVYYYYDNYSIVGTYNYSLWAVDSSGNGISSGLYQFEIIAEIKITDLINKWNFVSSPVNQTVDKTNLFVKYNGSEYNWSEAVANGYVVQFIYGWNRSAQNYEESGVLEPGEGYWMYAYDNMELWATGIGAIVEDNYITPLEIKWNIIGVPVNQTVNKADLIVNYAGTNYNWSEAVANGYVVQFIYGWNRTAQNYEESSVLAPGVSYWVYAYVECTLKWEVT
jgi:hypothetical protein